ncbi:hypothetical protein D9M70_520470 [compost metagenome]
MQANGNQRPGFRIEQPVRLGSTQQPIAAIGAGAADRGDLRILGERVGDLAIARLDLSA